MGTPLSRARPERALAPRARAIAAALLVCVSLGLAGGSGSKAAWLGGRTPGIARSEVVFMGLGAPALYRRFGATEVSWGQPPWNGGLGELAMETQRRWRAAANRAGARYSAGICLSTRFAGMIETDPAFADSICRALDGEPITIPWFWDQPHRGHPPYWFCTNSPRYRAYLRRLVEISVAYGADGLHIDEPDGTAGTLWSGGCFCRWCMAAFRAYLMRHVPREATRAAGVSTLDGFNYGEFLRRHGVTAGAFREKVRRDPPAIPLTREFVTFQYRSVAAVVAELRAHAERLVGHRLALSVNGGPLNPEHFILAPQLDSFCGEIPHDAASGAISTGPIFSYKLGDACGRLVAATAYGWDWSHVMVHGQRTLARAWIAQAYAFGHALMAPARQWAYDERQGTRWYWSAPGEYDDLYRFVRRHRAFLDGYEAVAHVGLVYSAPAFRRWAQQGRAAAGELAAQNVPFRLLLAGDDWVPARLRSADLAGLRAIVVAGPTYLDPMQQAVLDRARDRVVAWPDAARLRSLAPLEVEVRGASGILVVPRQKRGDPRAPYVCHLLNRSYTAEGDRMARPGRFRVWLARSLFPREVRGAVLYAPGGPPARVPVTASDSGVEVVVPDLEVWAVLALEHAPMGRLQMAARTDSDGPPARALAGWPSRNADYNGLTPLHYAATRGDRAATESLLDGGADPDACDLTERTPLHFAAGAGHLSAVEGLLARGASVDAADIAGETPLHRAAASGNAAVLETLLARGADAGHRSLEGHTPLHAAAWTGSAEAARRLLDRGARHDVFTAAALGDTSVLLALLGRQWRLARARDFWKRTPLHWAARQGQTRALLILLRRGASPGARDRDGRTPLHEAARAGHAPVCLALLKAGAPARVADRWGNTALHLAAASAKPALATLLIGAGVPIGARNHDGATALHAASSTAGGEGLVRALLAAGARPDALDGQGATPLHRAAAAGLERTVRILLEAGARPGAGDHVGWTPLHAAAAAGQEGIAAELLSRGAPLGARAADGSTPLHAAALWGHASMIRFLLARGADPVAPDNAGWTVLHWASWLGRAAAVGVLAATRARDAPDRGGATPLHRAAAGGDVESVRLLLAAGADPSPPDLEGATPLRRARERNRAAAADLLVERGAAE